MPTGEPREFAERFGTLALRDADKVIAELRAENARLAVEAAALRAENAQLRKAAPCKGRTVLVLNTDNAAAVQRVLEPLRDAGLMGAADAD